MSIKQVYKENIKIMLMMGLHCYLNKYMGIKKNNKKLNSRRKTKGGVEKIQAQTLRLSE